MDHTDELQRLYAELTPEIREALVVGGHHPLFLQDIADDYYDRAMLREIARLEADEDGSN